MSHSVELNPGEIKINFSAPTPGKISFQELGLKDEDLIFENGLVRLVFDFTGIGDHDYYKVPIIEFSYQENMSEIHWQCDFNKQTILDKIDHHGHSSIILLDRNKLSKLEHHHQNKLIIHGEFPEVAHVIAKDSFVNLFK